MSLVLRELDMNDEKSFLKGLEDWSIDDLSWYTFTWKKNMAHAEHLKLLDDQKHKSRIPPERVPSTILYAFVNGEIVGRLSIRYELNQNLLKRGGHVGYAVSPRQRNKGYATEMFKQSLEYCRKLNLEKILITCADNNIPSWKIIEKFGGVLENTILDVDEDKIIRRYWIDLK